MGIDVTAHLSSLHSSGTCLAYYYTIYFYYRMKCRLVRKMRGISKSAVPEKIALFLCLKGLYCLWYSSLKASRYSFITSIHSFWSFMAWWSHITWSTWLAPLAFIQSNSSLIVMFNLSARVSASFIFALSSASFILNFRNTKWVPMVAGNHLMNIRKYAPFADVPIRWNGKPP